MPSSPRLQLFALAALLFFAASSASEAECRYFWVVRDGLSSPESIDSLLARASRAGANGVIVQVVGRGESYYRSGILPTAEFTGFSDPLEYTILKAAPMGLEVHAWINAFLVWSSEEPPDSGNHVVNLHPEWFTSHSGGRSSLSFTAGQAEAAGLVGATLSPAYSEVREFVADIAAEIASDYRITGIHLDYIRYPNSSFGFAPGEVELYYLETGMSPDEDPERWNAWKTDQVTATVASVRAVLLGTDPEVLLSCAVMADPVTAVDEFSCDWTGWLGSGLVDYAFPMAYTTSSDRAMRLAEATTSAYPEKVVYGIGVWNQPVENALEGAVRSLELGAAGVCVFSLNSLPAGGEELLRETWGSGSSPGHGMSPAVFSRISVE